MSDVVLRPTFLREIGNDLCVVLGDLDRLGSLALDRDLQTLLRDLNAMGDLS